MSLHLTIFECGWICLSILYFGTPGTSNYRKEGIMITLQKEVLVWILLKSKWRHKKYKRQTQLSSTTKATHLHTNKFKTYSNIIDLCVYFPEIVHLYRANRWINSNCLSYYWIKIYNELSQKTIHKCVNKSYLFIGFIFC